ELVFSENKRNRGNTRTNRQVRGSETGGGETETWCKQTVQPVTLCVKEKKDGTLQKIGELIHSSPSILGSKAKTIIGLVSGHSAEQKSKKETVTTATKPRRGRRKLYKTDASSPLLESPHTTCGGAEEEKESDHLIIRRQLRSKTCRK
ncbi:kinesin-like protein KIF20B isoform X1, partial [Lates japonicus]